ncbi:hypothetical protein BaRGS_00028443 [Batillaria attramentaria]|uniref:Uncharacterized protein n=1 Tax=Batillaria attramentaria TaxID=370345 RepID=A0ABD0JYR4_9CAEN
MIQAETCSQAAAVHRCEIQMPRASGAKGLSWYDTGRNVYAGGCSTQQVRCKMSRPSGAKGLRWYEGAERCTQAAAVHRCEIQMPRASGAKGLRWYDTDGCSTQVCAAKCPDPLVQNTYDGMREQKSVRRRLQYTDMRSKCPDPLVQKA